MASVEGYRVVNDFLLALQQSPHWHEALVEWLARSRSGCAQFSCPVTFSCDIFLKFSDLVDEDTHERALLSTHGFGTSDLRTLVSDAELRLSPGEELSSVLDVVLSKFRPLVALPWFADAPFLLHMRISRSTMIWVGEGP